jgi:hypothetical protein
MIQITHTQLSNGSSTHRHIVRLWWTEPSTGTSGNDTRAQIVEWIENKGVSAYAKDTSGHQPCPAVPESAQVELLVFAG